MQPVKPGVTQGEKLRGADKMARIPVKIETTTVLEKKPDWIRVRLTHPQEVDRVRKILRAQKLNTVCEEAACPNLAECFGGGTATFMIMGDICTRRCPFCDVAHGRPNALDANEPAHLAETIALLALKYAVITSVDRDDLLDGGAQHFSDCIQAVREKSPDTLIEVLVPDFRGRAEQALAILGTTPPDVFNHNIETVARLYRALRPGSDYRHSLDLLKTYRQRNSQVLTKCGLMVGLGESFEEVAELLTHLKEADVDLVTIGQYLQPSRHHAPVQRYVHPDEFAEYTRLGQELGFKSIWAAPMVRSSYQADRQFLGEKLVRG